MQTVGPCTLQPDWRLPVILSTDHFAASFPRSRGDDLRPVGGEGRRRTAHAGGNLAAQGRRVTRRRSVRKQDPPSDPARVASGTLPLDHLPNLTTRSDEAHLLPVHGIGRWTTEMFLDYALAGRTCCRWTTSACVRRQRDVYGLRARDRKSCANGRNCGGPIGRWRRVLLGAVVAGAAIEMMPGRAQDRPLPGRLQTGPTFSLCPTAAESSPPCCETGPAACQRQHRPAVFAIGTAEVALLFEIAGQLQMLGIDLSSRRPNAFRSPAGATRRHRLHQFLQQFIITPAGRCCDGCGGFAATPLPLAAARFPRW